MSAMPVVAQGQEKRDHDESTTEAEAATYDPGRKADEGQPAWLERSTLGHGSRLGRAPQVPPKADLGQADSLLGLAGDRRRDMAVSGPDT